MVATFSWAAAPLHLSPKRLVLHSRPGWHDNAPTNQNQHEPHHQPRQRPPLRGRRRFAARQGASRARR